MYHREELQNLLHQFLRMKKFIEGDLTNGLDYSKVRVLDGYRDTFNDCVDDIVAADKKLHE